MRYFVEHLTYPSTTVVDRVEHVYISRPLPEGQDRLEMTETIAQKLESLGNCATYQTKVRIDAD